MNFLKIIIYIIEVLLFAIFYKYFGADALLACVVIILFMYFKDGVVSD